MRTKIIISLLSVMFLIAAFALIDIWRPYFNEYARGHNYKYPEKEHNFVVAMEPSTGRPPVFLKNIIIKAFPDFKVVFDNDASHPNLIIRSQEIIRAQRESSIFKDLDIPYITISGEPEGFPIRKYRNRGLPVADVVVYDSKKENEIYVPYFLWSGVELKTTRSYENYGDRKFLVYVSENCVEQREQFFALAKAANGGADALGSCSNTVGGKLIPGGYADLNDTYSQYNFVMAMENSQKPGYVTEKIINAFNSGAIPIYWGDSATVKAIFNNKAFIDLNDFENFEEAATFVNNLQNDPERLAQMQREPILNVNDNSIWSINNADSEYVANQALKLRALYDAKYN